MTSEGFFYFAERVKSDYVRSMRMLIEKFQSLPRFVAKALGALFLLVVFIYYPVGMVWVHDVDDSADFQSAAPQDFKGSYAVAMAVALIDREVNTHYWVSNDPIILPGAMLTRMPAFQRGVMSSLARFSLEMSDQISRARGSSSADPDLQKATGLINYSPYVWIWDFSVSWFPTASSEKQYREGMEALKRYNERLVNGQAHFERRADNLLDTLDRIASDLGSTSAAINDRLVEGSPFAFGKSADLYYNTKGRLYANYLLLRELEKDFAAVIAEKQLGGAWANMLESLKAGMELSNFLILNPEADNQFIPNHLAAQGFFLMRARTQMREITNILLK